MWFLVGKQQQDLEAKKLSDKALKVFFLSNDNWNC